MQLDVQSTQKRSAHPRISHRIRGASAKIRILLAAALGSAAAAAAQEASLKWQSSGANSEIGVYAPQRLYLAAVKPPALKKAPEGVTAPLYAELKIGPRENPASYLVLLDEPEGKPSRLFVDANGNGDLTDDPAVAWSERTVGGPGGVPATIRFGDTSVKIPLATGAVDAHLLVYRFNKKDPARADLADSIFYFRDYAFKGSMTFSGKSYAAMLVDEMATGDFRGQDNTRFSGVRLLIDINGDRKFDNQRESYDVKRPFNIGGTTWELAGLTAAGTFTIIKSLQTVDEIRPPVNLSKGAKAVTFAAQTVAGKSVKFPGDYKGKVVMLDFWATWCGPCLMELPNVISNYEKFHGQGFEILGISLDAEQAETKLAAFTKEKKMPWPQIYDGRRWQGEVPQLYGIESIPRMLLVDGDTGEILSDPEIRGPELGLTIEQALARKRQKK